MFQQIFASRVSSASDRAVGKVCMYWHLLFSLYVKDAVSEAQCLGVLAPCRFQPACLESYVALVFQLACSPNAACTT